MAVGCVDLNKPEVVEECAAAGNCTDDPSQRQKRDAREEPGPDSLSKDSPSDVADAALDVSIQDAPAEQKDGGPDTADVIERDSTDTDKADVRDAAADVGPDSRPDLLQPDRAPDLGVDLKPDLGPDLPPDLGPDLPPDLGPDLGPDLQPDLTPDTAPPNLLAYYRCEASSGTTLVDISGNGRNATLSAAGYSFVTGKVGRALSLANQGSVSLPAAMFANVTDITIALWVNVTTAASWARVFDIGVNANQQENTATGTRYMNLVPKNAGTNLAFSISKDGYDNEQVLTAATLPTGTWKHVALVLGSGSAVVYVDGTQAASSSTVTLRPRDLGPIDYAYLGKSQFGVDPYFTGSLDEVRIYDRALSAAEIQALYNGS